MLLDRIDIDGHGPLHHVELGPFAEHLNVVTGPRGSGKTAIVRFIRDSLVQRDYPLGMLSASSGRVVWADRNGLIHCRREQDGTAAGRRRVEFESRGETVGQLDSLGRSWFGDACESTDSGRAIESLQLPESIVDGVITDTAITSVARVVSACVRSGLDSPETYNSLPLHDESIQDYDRNRGLRQKLAEIEAELARLQAEPVRQEPLSPRHPASNQRYDGINQLHDRARRLQARQSELRRWVSEIDRELSNAGFGGSHFESSHFESTEYQYNSSITDQTLRRRLDDLDAQMIRWRRALSEVRGLRNAILSDKTRHSATVHYSVSDETSLRRERLNRFLRAVDRYDHSPSGDGFYRESDRPLHQIDDIEYRIESATRQIDWLLKRYADPQSAQYVWYQPLPIASHHGSTSLGASLRHIREDLHHLRDHTFGVAGSSYRNVGELEELRHSEQWLVASIGQLNRHRESLLRDAAHDQDAETSASTREGSYDLDVLRRDQRESVEQLNRVTAELDACLREASEIRRPMRSLPIIDRRWYDDFSYENLDHQSYMGVPHEHADDYHRWSDSSAFVRQIESLRRRRAEILEQLRSVQRPVTSRSPLADAASNWLIRLSGGRLQQIAWPYNMSGGDRRSYHAETYRRTGVTIDRRDEQSCPAADRALAVIAVRLAAGDLLARTGRSVPLVIETHGELFDAVSTGHNGHASFAYHDTGELARNNRPIASALRDYARAGRQIVLLTTDQSLAAEISRVGARSYQLHASPIVHAHRPLWKPQYEAEHYVGPHPHTYGYRGADEVLDHDRHYFDLTSGPIRNRSGLHATAPVGDVNRDLDTAWQESDIEVGRSLEFERGINFGDSSHRTDWSRDGFRTRDGYYVANSFTTNPPEQQTCCTGDGQSVTAEGQHPCCNQRPAKTIAEPASPFFLTVDSPVDQAPSIDAVAAARLRGLEITHINHLMQQDSNRLADALGLVRVDATTIRRWKAESRLVCQVPQLRGFDARVLVGCGVTTPAQLAAIHPVDLLQQVEAFLATDRGQQILLSGSSHELSRITSWIATANSSDGVRPGRITSDRDRTARGQSRRHQDRRNGLSTAGDGSEYAFDSARYEYETSNGSSRRSGRSSLRDNGANESKSGRRSRASRRSRSSNISRSDSAGSGTDRRSSRRGERSESGSRNGSARRSRRSSNRDQRESRDFVQYERQSNQSEQQQSELKFYLQRESPIIDAPSIGARMAERLNAVGIYTVNDLLNADLESLATELDHRRIDADLLLQWQQQASLVCRVPMLRGHDAQLLVAAEITTPEELAQCDADELFGVVDLIARSSEGKRIIRGGKLPDLEEVTEWISFGSQHRELMAA